MARLLKHQKQKLSSNCGPACVAILAATSQDKACLAMFGEKLTRDCYSDWSDLRRALSTLGLKFGKRAYRVSKWESVPEMAIVSCAKQKNGNWHWVVCSPKEGLLYDPLKSRPAWISKSRKKPVSYLTVKARA